MPTPTADDPLRTTDHAAPPQPEVPPEMGEVSPSLAAKPTVTIQPKQRETGDSASATQSEPSPSIPGYEIESVLGRGGMGVVYKARHLALKRTVALKMILTGSHTGPRELARFRLEAEAVARLQHPNVVQIHEVGEANGHPYCALEFVEGGNLAGTISGQPLPARESARLVEALARAMQLAHSRNVVHRDLKPANVLLAPDGTPRITDFGLARRTDSDSGETQAGAVMGTPSYMAPEQASGRAHEAGPAADIYALGAILYACLSGRPPFQGRTVVETLDQVRMQEPVPPSRLHKGVPLDLETICLRCLRKEPEKRYASAAELADDLGRFLRGEPVQARPVGRLERGWRWCQRKPALAAASALAILGLLLALGTGVAAFVTVNQSLDNETVERKKAEDLAAANKTLADKNKDLADEADERRERAEHLAVQAQFERAYYRYPDDPAAAMVTCAPLLASAVRLKDRAPEDSLRVLLGAWHDRASRHVFVHDGPVRVAAFSPDGKSIVTASDDGTGQRVFTAVVDGTLRQTVYTIPAGTARLWDSATGKPLGPPLQHQGRMRSAAFSPDGKRVVTASDDKTARLWDTATGQPLGQPLRHAGVVHAAVFSPDGTRVVTASADKTARLWDGATGQPLGPSLGHHLDVIAAAFSPDGKRVVTTTWEGRARLWDGATGRPLSPDLPHRSSAVAVAFSPDGKRFVTASFTCSLWDGETGKQVAPPLEHEAHVVAVAFSPDGKSIVTVGADKTARRWDSATGQPLGPLLHLQHQNQVVAATFSPDGKSILTASDDKTARLWDSATGQPLGPPLHHQGAVLAAAFSPDGKRVVTASLDKTARVWDSATPRPLGPPLQHQREVVAVAFSPDGKRVVTASVDRTARLWDRATSQPLCPPLVHDGAIKVAAFSPDGKRVLTASTVKSASPLGGGNSIVQLWDSATGQPVGLPLKHQWEVFAAAFSPDGKHVVTASGTADARLGEAQLWDIATGQPLGPPLEHQGMVFAVAFSPDGKRVATASYDKTARLWDSATGQPLGLPMQHQFQVLAVAFSPDGKRVLTGSTDKTARIWDSATGEPLSPPLQHQDRITSAAFCPDGTRVVTASDDGTARLWDSATGQPVGQPLRHGAEVNAAAFSPDGKSVLTISRDKTARLWDSATGLPLGPPLEHPDVVSAAAFSPDGNGIVTACYNNRGFSRDADKSARLWKAPRPIQGTPEQVLLWCEVRTGLKLDERGDVRVLDVKSWLERRERLELGGPPLIDVAPE